MLSNEEEFLCACHDGFLEKTMKYFDLVSAEVASKGLLLSVLRVTKDYLRICVGSPMSVVTFLLTKNVGLEAKDANGNTILLHTAYSGFEELTKILIQQGANVDHQNNEGCTALMIMFEHRRNINRPRFADIVKLLIEKNANFDLQDNYGNTVLLYVLRSRSNSSCIRNNIVKQLIEAGADPTIVSDSGVSVYDLIKKASAIELMVLLKQSIVNHQDKDGNTQLLKACIKRDEKLVLFLAEKGADFYIKNAKGKSAYSILKSKRVLTPGLQALKEKLILEQDIDDDDEQSFSSL